jgi:hypothetical protein
VGNTPLSPAASNIIVACDFRLPPHTAVPRAILFLSQGTPCRAGLSCRSPWLAVIFNGGGLRVGGSQTKADCRATRHRFMRRSTSFRYTAMTITAGARAPSRVRSATRPRDILLGIRVISAAVRYVLYGAQHYLANYVRHPRYPTDSSLCV